VGTYTDFFCSAGEDKGEDKAASDDDGADAVAAAEDDDDDDDGEVALVLAVAAEDALPPLLLLLLLLLLLVNASVTISIKATLNVPTPQKGQGHLPAYEPDMLAVLRICTQQSVHMEPLQHTAVLTRS
jgi:hypothetical protein